HRALHEEFYREDRSFALRRGIAVTLLGAASVGVFYAIYAFIVAEAIVGAITLGSMTLYLTVFRQGQTSFQSAMSSIARAYEDTLYMNNLFEYLAIESDDVPRRGPEDHEDAGAPSLSFEGVTFRYPGSERPCLENVTF